MIRFTLNNVYKLLCIQLKSLIACPLYFLHIYAVHLNYYNNILYYYYSILTYDLTANLIVLSSN